MSSARFYEELGNQSQKILTAHKKKSAISIETKTRNGIKVKSEITAEKNKDKYDFDSIITGEYAAQEIAKLTTTFSSDKIATSKLMMRDNFLKGLRIEISARNKPEEGKIKAYYQNQYISTSLDQDFYKPNCAVTLSTGILPFSAGFQSKMDLKNKKIDEINCIAELKLDSFTTELHSKNIKDVLGFSVYLNPVPDLELAGAISRNFIQKETDAHLACQFKVSETNKIKTSIDKDLHLQFAVENHFFNWVDLELSSQLNLKNIKDVKEHDVAVRLNIKAL
ncbi:hypothetical protein M0811_01367 [Anaeramoeba ignava]|uniref:Uncharacterized protein n=1 Tax=Anaeramoeba ignava TaxID=1746090 RepID=A0A9Q0LJ34_ANAIG|nr:hypothetical protein M0811_01367 [Anaeramoeba ignava]